MSITRVKPAGWGVNEELTSAQITQLDINAASALDKRSGQVDTISSTVTIATPFVWNVAMAAGTASVAFAATLNLDFGVANVYSIAAATGNTTITPINVRDGAIYAIRYTQSVGGGNTITWIGSIGSINFGSLSNAPDAGAGNHTLWIFLGIGANLYALVRNVE